MPKAFFRAAASLALGLGLAACAGTPPPAARPAIDPRIAAALEALAQPDPHLAIARVPGERTLGTPDGTLLNGLTGTEVELILGAPARVRVDPPAQVWQYDRPRCFVDVFLYTDDGETRVVYVQERSREVKKVPPGVCIGGVWMARQGRR